MLPLDELKQLDAKLAGATDVASLKPLYDRLGELAREYTSDFDLQLAVADSRQRVIEKGLALKRGRTSAERVEPVAAAAQPGGGWSPARAKVVEIPPALAPEPSLTRIGSTSKPLDKRRTLLIGAGLGLAAWLIIFVVLIQIARTRNIAPASPPPAASSTKAAAGTVPVDVSTSPPGASIRINGEEKCKSNCRLNLAPGNYQVTAVLDGFDPGASGVTVVPGGPINVSLSLVSQTATVRLFTDLEGGKVYLDGQPPGDLQDGQLVLERVPVGKHSVRVVGKSGEVSFAFIAESGKQPVITAPVAATNMLAVLVTSLVNQAKVLSSSPRPVSVALNGQSAGMAGPDGLELKDVPAGDQTLTVGEGAAQRKLVLSLGPMPVITAFLKSDITTGTLVVSTGEDDVTVFLNGKEYRRKTKRGEVRIQTVGEVAVRVLKSGFQPVADETVEVKKGEEARVAFHLKPMPKVAAMQIHGAAAGTQIMIDDRPAGRIGGDGSLSFSNLPPGEHSIEARRDGFVPKRIVRTLKAGDTLRLQGTDLALAVATGSLRLALNPADATVTYRRTDEPVTHTARDSTLRLEPGNYIFTAVAPGHVERTERATVAAGETHTLDIVLARETRLSEIAKPKPRAAASVNWSGWSKENGEYVRKGGNRVVVQSGPLSGTITFTAHLRKSGGLFHGGKLRWFIEDGGSVSQFEVDKKKFQAKGPDGSRAREHARDRAEEDDRTYTVQIEVAGDRIVHRLKVGDSWTTVDSLQIKGGADRKFGFVIPGNDEIAISNLRFSPK